MQRANTSHMTTPYDQLWRDVHVCVFVCVCVCVYCVYVCVRVSQTKTRMRVATSGLSGRPFPHPCALARVQLFARRRQTAI